MREDKTLSSIFPSIHVCIRNDTIYGADVADMKAGDVAMVMAADAIKRTGVEKCPDARRASSIVLPPYPLFAQWSAIYPPNACISNRKRAYRCRLSGYTETPI